MSDDRSYRSSEEYSGTVEEVTLAVSSNRTDIVAALSSGQKARERGEEQLNKKSQADALASDIGRDPEALAAVLSSGGKAKDRRQEQTGKKARANASDLGISSDPEASAPVVSSGAGAKASRQDRASKKSQANHDG